MDVTAWMNMPSPYQSRFFEALAAQPGVRVRLIYAYPISEDREALGWKRVDDDASYEIVMLRFPAILRVAWLAWVCRNDFQIVNSLWAVPVFAPVTLLHSVVGWRPLLIHSEASDPTLKRGWLRTCTRNAIGRLTALTRRFSVLAISTAAGRQYRSLGFRPDRVYPFGYFNGAISRPVASPVSPGSRLVFVGQLIKRKGWRVLLEAMRDLWKCCPDLTLDVIGTGPEESLMRRSCEEVGEARVSFIGPVEAALIPEHIKNYDLLVLPSSFDGWGLVINEALMVGVPVVVSTGCGASCLVENGVNGFTVAPEDPDALREGLRRFLSLDTESRLQMRTAALASATGLSLESAADYVVRCFEHADGMLPAKPTPPWLASREDQT